MNDIDIDWVIYLAQLEEEAGGFPGVTGAARHLRRKHMNREQAIERLQALGYKAKARDWNMGATIHVPIGQPQAHIVRDSPPIMSYKGVIYIYPADDSHWGMTDCNYIDRVYDSLSEAVDGTDAYIKFITPFLRP